MLDLGEGSSELAGAKKIDIVEQVAVAKERAESKRSVSKHGRIDASNYVLVSRCSGHLGRSVQQSNMQASVRCRPGTC